MTKELHIHNSTIHYRVTGQGSPVVLVHGFGETGEVWQHQAALLAQQFLVIVPDLPGSGHSSMFNDMSMEGMAGVIKAILDNESMATCCMIGHSMGGYIALAFAEKYPGYLSGFGLFHSTAYADTEEKKATRRKGIGFIREHGPFAFLQTTSPNLFSPVTKDRSPELVSGFTGSLNGQFSTASLVAYYESMIARPDRTAVLKNAPWAVLFIMGEFDNAVPLQDVLEQCHLPARSFIHILHRSGHMGMLEETAASNLCLLEYVKQVTL